MENKKNFIIIVSLYLLVILSLIIFEDIFSTVVFVIGLMIFHVFGFFGEREILNKINEDSLSKLLSKLNKTKKENEESYKRFISLTKTLGSGIIMVNEEGIINFSNKDFKLYFDVENDNLDYSSLIKIKPLYKFINEAYLLEKSLNKQIQYLEKYYDLVSTPLFEDDLFQGCLVVVHNITVLKTAESFQKQFTADVSHELKTPLSTIKEIVI
jgi:two-component system phosphate regulon sensor histidine kinase PhoR